MPLSESQQKFLETNHSAAMITNGEDGRPKVARCGVAMVDGKLWSSGTQGRVRTRRLRDDPACTLYVYDPNFMWLALETKVSILDGPDAATQNLRLFRVMQDKPEGKLSWFGKECDSQEFLDTMLDEERLIYEFDIERAYGTA